MQTRCISPIRQSQEVSVAVVVSEDRVYRPCSCTAIGFCEFLTTRFTM